MRGAAWLTIGTKARADNAEDRGRWPRGPMTNAGSATGEGLPNDERSGETTMKHLISTAEGQGGVSPLKGENPQPTSVPRYRQR